MPGDKNQLVDDFELEMDIEAIPLDDIEIDDLGDFDAAAPDLETEEIDEIRMEDVSLDDDLSTEEQQALLDEGNLAASETLSIIEKTPEPEIEANEDVVPVEEVAANSSREEISRMTFNKGEALQEAYIQHDDEGFVSVDGGDLDQVLSPEPETLGEISIIDEEDSPVETETPADTAEEIPEENLIPVNDVATENFELNVEINDETVETVYVDEPTDVIRGDECETAPDIDVPDFEISDEISTEDDDDDDAPITLSLDELKNINVSEELDESLLTHPEGYVEGELGSETEPEIAKENTDLHEAEDKTVLLDESLRYEGDGSDTVLLPEDKTSYEDLAEVQDEVVTMDENLRMPENSAGNSVPESETVSEFYSDEPTVVEIEASDEIRFSNDSISIQEAPIETIELSDETSQTSFDETSPTLSDEASTQDFMPEEEMMVMEETEETVIVEEEPAQEIIFAEEAPQGESAISIEEPEEEILLTSEEVGEEEEEMIVIDDHPEEETYTQTPTQQLEEMPDLPSPVLVQGDPDVEDEVMIELSEDLDSVPEIEELSNETISLEIEEPPVSVENFSEEIEEISHDNLLKEETSEENEEASVFEAPVEIEDVVEVEEIDEGEAVFSADDSTVEIEEISVEIDSFETVQSTDENLSFDDESQEPMETVEVDEATLEVEEVDESEAVFSADDSTVEIEEVSVEIDSAETVQSTDENLSFDDESQEPMETVEVDEAPIEIEEVDDGELILTTDDSEEMLQNTLNNDLPEEEEITLSEDDFEEIAKIEEDEDLYGIEEEEFEEVNIAEPTLGAGAEITEEIQSFESIEDPEPEFASAEEEISVSDTEVSTFDSEEMVEIEVTTEEDFGEMPDEPLDEIITPTDIEEDESPEEPVEIFADELNELQEDIQVEENITPSVYSLDNETPMSAEKREEVVATQVDPLADSTKDEIKKIMRYLDNLLEDLPEDKIRDFSQSEYYDLYVKILDKLGV